MVEAPPRPPLVVDLDVEVCVIGGGSCGPDDGARDRAQRLVGGARRSRTHRRRRFGAQHRLCLAGLCRLARHASSVASALSAPRICGRWRKAASIMCATPSARTTARDRTPGWLALCFQVRQRRRVHPPCRSSRRIWLRDRRLADRTGARGAAQRALFSRHPLSARDQHPSAQLRAGACCRGRAGRRAHFRAYAGVVDRSRGRAQTHRHAARAAARQSRRAVRELADRRTDAARSRSTLIPITTYVITTAPLGAALLARRSAIAARSATPISPTIIIGSSAATG